MGIVWLCVRLLTFIRLGKMVSIDVCSTARRTSIKIASEEYVSVARFLHINVLMV